MSETQDLSDILSGAEPPAASPPQVDEAPAESVEARPRDEHGRFTPKGESEAEIPPIEAAPPAAVDDEGPNVPRKALLDERSKRQTLESQLQQMQRQFEQLQQQQNPPEPPPSLWEDEQGWQQHFGQTLVRDAVQEATRTARVNMSEMMVRQAHPDDFDAKKAAWLEAIAETPSLAVRAMDDPHPWNFAYNYASNQERMKELSAVNVADLEAKIRAQVAAEYEAKAQEALKHLPAGVPPSLSQERNVGSRQGPTWAGPAPLGDLLNRR